MRCHTPSKLMPHPPITVRGGGGCSDSSPINPSLLLCWALVCFTRRCQHKKCACSSIMSFAQFNRGLGEVFINIVRLLRRGSDLHLPLVPDNTPSPPIWQCGDMSVYTLAVTCKLSLYSLILPFHSHLCFLTAVGKQSQKGDNFCLRQQHESFQTSRVQQMVSVQKGLISLILHQSLNILNIFIS